MDFEWKCFLSVLFMVLGLSIGFTLYGLIYHQEHYVAIGVILFAVTSIFVIISKPDTKLINGKKPNDEVVN